jgi:hypothetical protein
MKAMSLKGDEGDEPRDFQVSVSRLLGAVTDKSSWC